MRCCEAWKLVEDCFDTSSFECVDFQRLSQIIASLTRENLEASEAEITNLPWTQTEKDTALARCRGGQRAWRNKKPVLSLSAVRPSLSLRHLILGTMEGSSDLLTHFAR